MISQGGYNYRLSLSLQMRHLRLSSSNFPKITQLVSGRIILDIFLLNLTVPFLLKIQTGNQPSNGEHFHYLLENALSPFQLSMRKKTVFWPLSEP